MLSMILWSLIVVVTIKYVLILLRADNNGEGGTLSLTALAFRAVGRRTPFVLMLGIIGAAMFLGDSVITPAISVLSAVEGLKIVTPTFEHYVVPLTIVILVALFAVQRRGTARVAAFFGPVMVVWFVAVAAVGLLHISDDRRVFAAINPYYAVMFLASATASSAWSRSVRYSSPSPAARRSMPISAISAASRSRPPGSASSCRRWSSTISARARCCSAIRPRSPTRSTSSYRRCCCFRW